jgi:ABC-type phosphate/phosphonate transport system substrate-binding protein
VQAVLVDALALQSYEEVKSGCFARLKVLKESERFPPGVVAYRQGALDNATLNKFREGMLTANQNARGKDLMSFWKLTAFENVTADFEQMITDIVRAYPPPPALAAAQSPAKN